MFIEERINSLRASGRLFLIPQSWPGLPIERLFYASDSVKTLILGPWNDHNEEKRAYELRAEIDRFIDGKTIFVRAESEERD